MILVEDEGQRDLLLEDEGQRDLLLEDEGQRDHNNYSACCD